MKSKEEILNNNGYPETWQSNGLKNAMEEYAQQFKKQDELRNKNYLECREVDFIDAATLLYNNGFINKIKKDSIIKSAEKWKSQRLRKW